MAVRTISNAGGNYNAVGTWVEGAVPTAADDVVATATSGNLTVNISSACRSINLTNYVGTLTQNSVLTIGTSTPGPGNVALKFVAGMTYTVGSTTLVFASTSVTQQTIDFASKTTRAVTFTSGSWKYLSGHTMLSTSQLWLIAGSLDTNGQACSWGNFSGTNSPVKSLTAGTSTITLTGFDPTTTKVWDLASATNFTVNLASSTIVIADTSSSAKIFDGHSKTYGALTVTGGGTGSVTITGSNVFSTLTLNAPKTVIFGNGMTSTMTNFVATGSPGNVITIRTDSAGASHSLSEAPALVSCNYLSLKDINATGGASWYAGANSTNVSGNTGWVFTAPVPTPIPVTGIARGVTDDVAVLKGTVDASGSATTYYFQYGTTTGYGTNVPAGLNGSAGSSYGPGAVSQSISGLNPNTTYHYRVVATNTHGTVQGSDATLRTDPTPDPNQRIEVDAVTERRIAAGGPSDSFTHTPVGAPQAVVVLVAGRTANLAPASAITYGGVDLTQQVSSVGASAPFPSSQVWYLDDAPNGAQTVALTKPATVDLDVVVVSVLALGTPAVDDSDFTTGSQKTQTTNLTSTGPGIALAINCSSATDLAFYHTDSTLAEEDEGATVYGAQYTPVDAVAPVAIKWTYATSSLGSRSGILLKDPNPGPPATEATVDFETGDLVQTAFIQAVPGRLTVVDTPALQGAYTGRFELQQADVEPDTGLKKCEIETGRRFPVGAETYFRFLSQVESWDFTHWGLIWQVHGTDLTTPPLALYLGDGVSTQQFRLQNGAGSPVYWLAPFVGLGISFEIVVHVIFSQTVGVVEVWLNGVKQTLTNAAQTITGANTIGDNPPGYDRMGIYRSVASTTTAVVYHDDYRIRDAFFSDPPFVPAVMVIPLAVSAAQSSTSLVLGPRTVPLDAAHAQSATSLNIYRLSAGPDIDLPTTLTVASRSTTLQAAGHSTSLAVDDRRTTVTLD